MYYQAFFLLSCYFVGGILWGEIIAKVYRLPDLRQNGSGNIGATNVLRVGGKKLAALTLLLDAGKGFITVYAASMFFPHLQYYAAVAVIIGHMYPIMRRFAGGKGIATALGALLALKPVLAIICAIAWSLIFFLQRRSSVASIIVSLGTPALAYFLGLPENGVKLLAIISTLIIWKHRTNIQRLLKNQEKSL